jgi:hypothetical protein
MDERMLFVPKETLHESNRRSAGLRLPDLHLDKMITE